MATNNILQLLTRIGVAPEKEITPDSTVDDFFNTVVKFKNGRRAGGFVISIQSSSKIPLYIDLHDGMTHQELFISLTIGLFIVVVFAKNIPVQLSKNHQTVYSYYDDVIKRLRWKLRYVNRRLRKAQRKFHNAEARFCRMLTAEQASRKDDVHYAARVEAMRLKADYYMEMFSETFLLREKLMTDIEAAIHADAESKKALEHITQTVVN